MTWQGVAVGFFLGWAFFRLGAAAKSWLGRRRLRVALASHQARVEGVIRGLISQANLGARPHVAPNWDAMVAAETKPAFAISNLTAEDCGHEECRAERAAEVEAARRGMN